MSTLWQRLGMSLAITALTVAFAVPMQMAPSQEASAAQDKASIDLWFDTTGGAETAECTTANLVEPFNEQSETSPTPPGTPRSSWQARWPGCC